MQNSRRKMALESDFKLGFRVWAILFWTELIKLCRGEIQGGDWRESEVWPKQAKRIKQQM